MKIALVVNPLAGLGGPAGLKGSDASDTARIARERGVTSRIAERLKPVLAVLGLETVECTTVSGALGESWCKEAGIRCTTLSLAVQNPSTAEDTRAAVALLQATSPDLLIFAGGDGTARDVLDAVSPVQVVLGVPCGVKMHSAVFANNPAAAAEVVQQMNAGQLLTVSHAEVRDIDESAFRQGIVQASFYGEMWVPEALRYMQQVKAGGLEVEALVVEEIAADIIENMQPDITYLMGSGSTTAAIMAQLGLDNTLLGVDVIKAGKVLIADAYEAQLYDIASNERSDSACKIVVTVIGGQGHLFGRGNQQLSARVIRAVGQDNILVVATKSKLEALANGVVVDTGDAALDQSLSGFIRVVTGYEDAVLCPVRC
ncbi:MAG: putative polyphosphate/ATP-dependent NAD kinase [Candidatus Azotimanducaceae bacterium]|jgi:predicted polyphosphate/ATP-dependent NAD kinase